MQQLTADLFISVDGWARGETSPGYFGYFGPELDRWISDELERPHHQLLGRRSFEMLSEIPDEARDARWQRMTSLPTTVFSRTLDTVSWDQADLCSDLVSGVEALRASSPVPLRTIGSLSVVRQLLDAQLVDRLRLMVFPLLVGPDGREAAFSQVAAADLELVDQRVLDHRLLLIEYRPTGDNIPRQHATSP